jgi:NADH dehydrogenase
MTSVRRVTIFGGSGFIGRYIVQRLAQQGAVITVVSRHAGRARHLQPMGDVGQIVTVNASLAHEDVIRQSMVGADSVINLVGILAESGRQRFETLQHDGAALIARLATETGVQRFVQFSAIGADQASPSTYARSKARGEEAVKVHFPSATILRPSIVFGPEDEFFNRFARMAQYSPILPLIGGGISKFQPVYVGDVADAAVTTLNSDLSAGKTYELGGPLVYSFRELMEMLLALIDKTDDELLLNRHALVSIPYAIAEFLGVFAQLLPNAPLTRDQVKLLRRDNVVSPGALGLRELGIEPTAAALILPTYLSRYRVGGWYSARRMA